MCPGAALGLLVLTLPQLDHTTSDLRLEYPLQASFLLGSPAVAARFVHYFPLFFSQLYPSQSTWW